MFPESRVIDYGTVEGWGPAFNLASKLYRQGQIGAFRTLSEPTYQTEVASYSDDTVAWDHAYVEWLTKSDKASTDVFFEALTKWKGLGRHRFRLVRVPVKQAGLAGPGLGGLLLMIYSPIG